MTTRTEEVKYGTSIELPEASTREGAIFKVWKIGEKTYNEGESIKVEGDMTIQAVWEEIYHTVSYNANGGEKAPEKQ